MKNKNWYVSANVHQDYETMLFTKRIKMENLNMDKDRTIAHVEGITLEEAEANAKLMAAAQEMLAVLLDLRDGGYNLHGDAWSQIDRAINIATGKQTVTINQN